MSAFLIGCGALCFLLGFAYFLLHFVQSEDPEIKALTVRVGRQGMHLMLIGGSALGAGILVQVLT